MTDTPLRVLIADDEPLAREALREFVEAQSGFSVCGEASTGREVIGRVRADRPDILLLDVQMPELNGFQALNALDEDERPVVVFITAYESYAVAAFDASAADYLLKPYDEPRLREALDRAAGRAQRRRGEGSPEGSGVPTPAPAEARGPLERFVVKQQGRIVLVPTRDVDWLEGAGNYVELHVNDRTYLIRDSLNRLERDLSDAEFVRIHRSAIVRLSAIKELERLGSGDYTVRLLNGRELTLSRSFRRNFEERLGRTL